MSRNRARCRKCSDVIESKHTHDFVRCRCGAIFIDGGPSYRRGGAADLDDIIVVLDDGTETPLVSTLDDMPPPRDVVPWVCTATKHDGTPCTRYGGTPPPRLCWQHSRSAPVGGGEGE